MPHIADAEYQKTKEILRDSELIIMQMKKIEKKKSEIIWGTIHEVNPSTPITVKNWKKYCYNDRIGSGVRNFTLALLLCKTKHRKQKQDNLLSIR